MMEKIKCKYESRVYPISIGRYSLAATFYIYFENPRVLKIPYFQMGTIKTSIHNVY